VLDAPEDPRRLTAIPPGMAADRAESMGEGGTVPAEEDAEVEEERSRGWYGMTWTEGEGTVFRDGVGAGDTGTDVDDEVAERADTGSRENGAWEIGSAVAPEGPTFGEGAKGFGGASDGEGEARW
jgi:hypothetical protein